MYTQWLDLKVLLKVDQWFMRGWDKQGQTQAKTLSALFYHFWQWVMMVNQWELKSPPSFQTENKPPDLIRNQILLTACVQDVSFLTNLINTLIVPGFPPPPVPSLPSGLQILQDIEHIYGPTGAETGTQRSVKEHPAAKRQQCSVCHKSLMVIKNG